MFGKKKELSRTYIFEEMSPTKAVLTLAIPTIVNQLVNVIYNLADTFFIGKLDNPSMIAALSVSGPIMIVLTAFGNIFVVGGCSLISRALGEDNVKKAEYIATLCPIMSVFVGIILTILFTVFLEPISVFAGSTADSLQYTKDYLFWVFAMNAIPNICSVTLGAGLRGRGYSKYEMIGITFGNVLNIILDPIFIFVLDMGVKGAAFATFLSTCASLLFFLIFAQYIQKKKHLYCDYKEFKFNKSVAAEVIVTGFPACFHQILACISNSTFNRLLSEYSDTALAGVGIVRKLEHVAGQIVIGLNQGSIPLLSYNFGNRNYERLNKVKNTVLYVGIAFGVIAAVVLVPLAPVLISVFIKEPQTVAYGTKFLRIFAFLPLTMSVNNAARTFYQSIGQKTKSSFISTLRNIVVFLPLIFILKKLFGLNGLMVSNITSDIILNVICMIMVNVSMKKIKKDFEQNT